jgi:hypothetical protein
VAAVGEQGGRGAGEVAEVAGGEDLLVGGRSLGRHGEVGALDGLEEVAIPPELGHAGAADHGGRRSHRRRVVQVGATRGVPPGGAAVVGCANEGAAERGRARAEEAIRDVAVEALEA